jgi:hypothetical protein
MDITLQDSKDILTEHINSINSINKIKEYKRSDVLDLIKRTKYLICMNLSKSKKLYNEVCNLYVRISILKGEMLRSIN